MPLIQVQRPHGPLEARRQQFGEHTGAAHALVKLRVVIGAAAALSYQAHDVSGAQGKVFVQPLFEQRRDFQRQAQQDVRRGRGTSLFRRFQDGFEFAVV